MRPTDDINKSIRKLNIKASAELDAKIHNEIDRVLKESNEQKPSLWRIVTRTKIVKLAIAAGVIVAVCLFFAYHGSNERVERPQIAKTISSPAELTTLASLNNAFRAGGFEAVDKQFARVSNVLGPKPQNPNMQDLYADLNN